jgi:hypothetical protein
MLGQASIEANGILSRRPASRVPAGDRVVTMLLQSLPGGKEALKWEAEDWAGRETLQGWDEESIEGKSNQHVDSRFGSCLTNPSASGSIQYPSYRTRGATSRQARSLLLEPRRILSE